MNVTVQQTNFECKQYFKVHDKLQSLRVTASEVAMPPSLREIPCTEVSTREPSLGSVIHNMTLLRMALACIKCWGSYVKSIICHIVDSSRCAFLLIMKLSCDSRRPCLHFVNNAATLVSAVQFSLFPGQDKLLTHLLVAHTYLKFHYHLRRPMCVYTVCSVHIYYIYWYI